MKIYKTLKEFLENNNSEDLENTVENYHLGNDYAIKLLVSASLVIYLWETGEKEFPIDPDLMQQLVDKISMSISLYLNIRNGDIELVDGDITLTGEEAKFRLTQKGIESAKNLI